MIYSKAPRCEECNQKPRLDRSAALALVDASPWGVLVAHECPRRRGVARRERWRPFRFQVASRTRLTPRFAARV